MISKLLVCSIILGLAGCASSESKTEVNPQTVGTKAADPSEDSQVLSKQKCPRHSKLVDGKCVLQVESDD